MADQYSDSDKEGESKQEIAEDNDDLENLFGSEDEGEQKQEDEGEQTREDDENAENEGSPRYYGEEEEAKPTRPVAGTWELMYTPVPKFPSDAKLFSVKLPNILNIETRPFDRDTFDENDWQEEDDEGNKKLRLNVMRWRYAKDENGDTIKESNARFVKWSDGSLQLMVGNEVLNVEEQDITGDHSYLFVRQQSWIQFQTPMTSKLVFRPTSLESKAHKKLTLAMVERTKKDRKVKLVETTENPEKARERVGKLEEDRRKSSEQLAKEQAKVYSRLAPDFLEEGEYKKKRSSSSASSSARRPPSRRNDDMNDFIDDADADEDDEYSGHNRKKSRRRDDSDDD